ncbi:MAG: hypothetical protein Kow0026_02640 [Oricola sp.]
MPLAILPLAVLPLAAGGAEAAITGSAVASGSYRGTTVLSDTAKSSLAVQPASPALDVQLGGGYDDSDGVPGKSVGDTVEYEIAVANAGDVGIDGLALTVSLAQDGEALSPVQPPHLAGGDDRNPGVLDRGETWRFTARYPVTFGELERRGPILALAAVSGLGTGREVSARSRAAVDLPPLQDIDPRRISLSHVPAPGEAGPGDTVDYAVTISNRSDRVLAARLTGTLAKGMALAQDGVPRDGREPVRATADGKLDFGVIQVAAGGSATVHYSGRLTGDAAGGYPANEAAISDPATGLALIAPSRATIRAGRAVRNHCAEVAIHVFDDRNRDGRAEAGEPGLSGVRVRAEGGVPLTTGPDGRFHSPCETVSRLAGIELRFDLDEGTLPEGYYVTTPDPFAVRVERGTAARVTFGAAAARIVRVDLNAAAFGYNSVMPDAETADGITRLIPVLARGPSILRLTYYGTGETMDLVEHRLAAVRQMVLDRWAVSGGGYDLKIEARLVLGDG